MTVCSHIRDVDGMTISRVNVFPQNHEHFTFPALISVVEAARPQAVARALCTLPVFPSGPTPMSCPVDLGISYVLRFITDDIKLAAVTINATGCREVTGLAQPRWTALSPAFWSVLGTAAGIAPADLYTFSGAPTS